MTKTISFTKIQDYPGNDNRFRFRIYDTEEKTYTSLCWNCRIHNSFLEPEGDHLILEQCTGLKDRNGELIFEGDVVRCITGAVGKVVYFHAGFKVVFDIPMSYPCDIWEDQEIIGNIHEDQFRDLTELMESKVKE